MNTVIYLEELGRHPDRQMHAGVSAFARKAGWDVQSVPNVHTKAQLSNLVKIWDPLGFIAHSGNRADGCKLVGTWRVYGDVEAAKKIFEQYRKCTESYCRMWSNGVPLTRLAVAI